MIKFPIVDYLFVEKKNASVRIRSSHQLCSSVTCSPFFFFFLSGSDNLELFNSNCCSFLSHLASIQDTDLSLSQLFIVNRLFGQVSKFT